MKVVLIDEAPGLGIAGDVRDVRDGYARNYLIPKRLAVPATPQELSRADARRRAEIARRTKLNLEMESVGKRLEEDRLLIPVRVGPGGRLYGSVTSAEIATAVNEMMGVEIDRRAVPLTQPIRALGHHQAPVRLAPDVIPMVTITVYAEGTEPPPLVDEAAEDADGAEETPEETGGENAAAEARDEAEAAPAATAPEDGDAAAADGDAG